MKCCYNKNKTNSVTLEFCRKNLLYDIANYAYIEGSIMNTDYHHQRHTVQDACEAGNVDRVTRVLDLAHAKITEMLYPFTKYKIASDWFSNELKDKCMYEIELTVPDTFSQTTLEYLELLIHNWLVCLGVADWLSITNTQKSIVWQEKSDMLEQEIQSSLSSRTKRQRIRLHPF